MANHSPEPNNYVGKKTWDEASIRLGLPLGLLRQLLGEVSDECLLLPSTLANGRKRRAPTFTANMFQSEVFGE